MKKKNIIIPADPCDSEDRSVNAEGVLQGQRARLIRKARIVSGLTQQEFSKRFSIPIGTLRDWEQARAMPPEYAVLYVKACASHPEFFLEAA